MNPNAERALKRMERYRPTRSAWAQTLVRYRNCRLYQFQVMCLSLWGVPFLGGIGFALHEPTPVIAEICWALACLLLLCRQASVWAMMLAFRRSAVVLCESEFAVIMTYVENCPRIRQAVSEWMRASEDGMLSPYEVLLVFRAARAQGTGLGVAYSGPGATLDEEFYQCFPAAPRFSIGDQEAKSFSRSVACLDRAVGHLKVAKSRYRERELMGRLPSADAVLVRPRL